MPWHIEADNPSCDGFAVVKDDDGTVEGCHASEESAQAQLGALYAAEAMAEEMGEPDAGDEPEAIVELEQHARADKTGREERRGSLHVRNADQNTATADLEVYGYASKFEQPYPITDLYGEYEEVVRTGAFAKTIDRDDVRLYVNHDGMALARTSAGNLELAEDAIGLEYRATLDRRVSVVSDLEHLMRAGIMRESSFAFQPVEQRWNADYTRRELLEVRLFDVSVVSLPANPAANAGVRAEAIRWLAELEPAALAGELRDAGVGASSLLEAITVIVGATAEVREGKVLSSKNAKLVREAIDALTALIDAADGPSRDAGAMMIEQALTEVLRRRR